MFALIHSIVFLSLSESGNVDLLKKLYQDYEVPLEIWGLVPITFIGERYFFGFSEEIGQEIEDCIVRLLEGDPYAPCQPEEHEERKISLPFIGEIDIEKYSLPALAIFLGALDGFNICSLGALIVILGLVLALKSRKKILIFGGLFIFTTAVVYGLLIVLWYQIFSFFLSYLKIMNILIGILAMAGGIYFLKEFIKFRKQGPTCKIGSGKKIISKFSSRFQESVQKAGSPLLLIGSVLLFAGIITVIEFPCSAAVPVVFAGVLANSQLSTFSYLSYIVLFALFYMLDEIIVFLIAFFTMTIWLASSKFVIWTTLIEAIILFILGLYYLGFGGLL